MTNQEDNLKERFEKHFKFIRHPDDYHFVPISEVRLFFEREFTSEILQAKQQTAKEIIEDYRNLLDRIDYKTSEDYDEAFEKSEIIEQKYHL